MAEYITLPEVKEALPDLGTDADSLLGKLIVQASARVDAFTQRSFGLTTATKTFNATDYPRLFVPDLVSVTTLTAKPGTTSAAVTVPSTDFFLGPAGRRPGWPAQWIDLSDIPLGSIYSYSYGYNTVSITGVWGWPSVPDDIRNVTLEMVVRMWKARASGFSDEGLGDIGGGQTSRYMTWEQRSTLENYKPVQVF